MGLSNRKKTGKFGHFKCCFWDKVFPFQTELIKDQTARSVQCGSVQFGFQVKFVQTYRRTEGRTTVKQYAPDLSIRGH